MSARVVPRHSTSGTESMLRFFTGSLDVAYLGLVPFTLGRLFGLPLVALSPCGRWTEAVLSKALDLDHRSTVRVATVLGSNAHFLAWEWAQEQSLNVVFLDLPPAEQVAALELGLVDAVSCWEPFVSTALRSGAHVLYAPDDLHFEVTDFLCTSEDAIENHGSTIAAIKELHDSSADRLATGVPRTSLDLVSTVVGIDISDTWLGGAVFPAPAGFLAHDERDVTQAVSRAEAFLRLAGLSGRLDPPDRPCWADLSQSGGAADGSGVTINIGYSDDPMCAPLVLAQVEDRFSEVGLSLDIPKDLESARIARLPSELQSEVRMIQGLVETDPELAVMKSGRVLERELHVLYGAAFSTATPKRVSEVLRSLEEAEALPPLLASSADWIRKVRNVATHGEGVSADVARKAYLELLEFVEWSVLARSEIQQRCGRCHSIVDSTWTKCPTCTAELTRSCDRCGMELRPEWKLCPSCG